MSRQKKPLDEYESAGPMTRQRLKRQREGMEEDIWGNRNTGNSNNKKRIDITPLDALTIASSMLNYSYGGAETQLSESEEEGHHSLQKQPEPIAPPVTADESAWCCGHGARNNNNTRIVNIEDGEMSAFAVASELLGYSFV